MPFRGEFILLAFLAFWVIVCNIIGWTSGWWALANAYPTDHFEGTRRRARSVRLGSANYNGCVTIGANANGLYLATLFLFRPGHPPLFIPWNEISVRIVKGWFWLRYLELTFDRVPRVVLRIPEKYGKELATDANRAWFSSGHSMSFNADTTRTTSDPKLLGNNGGCGACILGISPSLHIRFT